MAKVDEKRARIRAEILDKLADHILKEGLAGASLRPLAKAAGLSDRMLLYYFKDKAEILSETLSHIAARLTTILSEAGRGPMPYAALKDELTPFILDEALWPYLALWLQVAAYAAAGDAFYKQIGEAIGRGFHGWIMAQLKSTDDAAKAREASALFTMLEGALVLKAVGLEAMVREGTNRPERP